MPEASGLPLRPLLLRFPLGRGVPELHEGSLGGIPDRTFEKQSISETGPDLVAAQLMMTATNHGSMMGLPPTGKPVAVCGADFFPIKDGLIQSVTTYFDSRAIPTQLDLDLIEQPKQIGHYSLAISPMVQTGKTEEPGAFSITYLEAADQEAVQKAWTRATRSSTS